MVVHLCVYGLLFPPLLVLVVPFLLVVVFHGAGEERPYVRRHAASAFGALVSYLVLAVLGLVLLEAVVGLFILAAVAVLVLLLPTMNVVRVTREDAPHYPLSLGE